MQAEGGERMAREKEGFRDVLQDISERFDGRSSLKIEEACEYVGINRRTALKDSTFPAKKVAGKYIVSTVRLAMWCCT